MDKVRNQEVRGSTGIDRELASRVDQRVLRQLGQLEGMDQYRELASRVDQRVLRQLGQLEGMDQYRELASRVDQRVLRQLWQLEGMDQYVQKCVEGASKWRAGAGQTEVRLQGWCEGGRRQQSDYDGGCVTMHERCELRSGDIC